MMVFPKALFLVTDFPEIVKNSIFRLNYKNFQNCLKVSKQFVFFVQTQEKLTHVIKYFEKYPKIMRF